MKRSPLARKTPLRRNVGLDARNSRLGLPLDKAVWRAGATLKRRKRLKVASKYRPSVAALDALCREVVFLRDKSVCQKGGCEPSRPKQWCHIRSRRYRSTRWDLMNSLVLCAGHHLWAHHEPIEFGDWFRGAFPVRAALLKLKSQTSGGGKVDMAAVRLYLEAEKERLTA